MSRNINCLYRFIYTDIMRRNVNTGTSCSKPSPDWSIPHHVMLGLAYISLGRLHRIFSASNQHCRHMFVLGLFFFKAIRPQAARHVVPGDCFITRSISTYLMPERVSLPVSQQQMAKFCIKHGQFHKETTFDILPCQLPSKISIIIQGLLK